MALKVSWTENALADYKKVVDCLLKEWPISVAEEFVKNVESRIETITIFQTLEFHLRKLKKLEVLFLQNIISFTTRFLKL